LIETDVVVVGSGCAGLTAALTAAVGGAKVTLLERANLFGGTTAISGGGMWLPGHRLDPDFSDSQWGAKVYLQRLTMGLSQESVLDRYVEEAGQIPEFLSKYTPLTFVAEKGRPDYHAPWEGSSTTSRTVFPDFYDLGRLGKLQAKIRRPRWPGGVPPIQHSEEEVFGDLERLKKLVEERIAKGVAARGLALVGGLLEGCVAHGVTLVSDVRVTSLLEEGSRRISGVLAERGGESESYHASAGVVLASGGFEWNRALWDSFMGVPWDGPSSPPCNEGDGLKMAMKVGAKLAHLDKATWIPSRYLGESYEGRPYMRNGVFGAYAGEILVNPKGRRFANEALNYNDIGMLMTRFDPHTYEFVNYPCFVIADARRLNAPLPPTDSVSADADHLVQAPTLHKLAGELGIDADGLEEQVSEFNEHAKRGEDPFFHRGEKPWELYIQPASDQSNPSLAPIVEPPFIGHRVRAGVFGTRGGPVIDENAQILDLEDRPILGLYGAGNAVAHPFGPAYPGGGGTLGPAVTFGHIAGRSVETRVRPG
jgi:3-oxosteroid 1-dehydrogenase